MDQKNSYISMMESIAILNKNSTEIIARLSDVVGSDESSITIKYMNTDGSTTQYELPTIGTLKKDIDIANSNIKKLSGLDGDNSVVIQDGNSTRQIKSVDINREPKQIKQINTVTQFKQNNNWFFEGLMNPLISVELDLDGKIEDSVKKILSRRYIVKFERNEDGTLTDAGQKSLTEFENKFLNTNNFTINEFISWLTLDTNLGVLNQDDPNYYMDEEVFDLNYKEINYKGYYSVMKIETDKQNNKVWYHLNTLKYYAKDGSTGTLSIGDILSLSKDGDFSKYKITEVNTSNSLFRLGLERVEGYNPVPVGTNVLEFYSELNAQKKVKISIGFDEYNVLFTKPINTENYIIGSAWSKGMSFYSNDLVLDTDNNVSMNDFYVSTVNDYGALLNDLVKKKIPTSQASIPNTPNLITDNFKVVQINKHLTDTTDNVSLKKLHSQKNTSKTKLQQIQEAITEKNRELNTKQFKSIAEKSKSQNELDKLIKNQESETKLYSSLVSQITNATSEGDTSPKFRVRGFWDIPDPIIKSGYKTQEVIGFEVQYRYSSKFGTENKTEGFEKSNDANVKETGYYSNWIPYNTDIRKRAYDEFKQEWYWETEDISDADTPNINQLDIALQPNERVEVRMRSISEVGYPETPITSDWSSSLTMDFPDELKDVLGENQFILEEASKEEMRVSFANELTSKGIPKHISEAFYANETYFAHTDTSIATSFKDSFGNTLTLFDYLKLLNDKISSLEESIKRAKGELEIVLFKDTDEQTLVGDSKTDITIYCDDYAVLDDVKTQSYASRIFKNELYLIQDYYLEFRNISKDNPLGFLTTKSSKINTNYSETNMATIIDDVGVIKAIDTTDDVFIQLMTSTFDSKDADLYKGSANYTVADQRVIGDDILPVDVVVTNNLNIGGSIKGNIATPKYWVRNETATPGNPARGILYNSGEEIPVFGATVHPFFNSLDNIRNEDGVKVVNPDGVFRVPLNLYFKMNTLDPNYIDSYVWTNTDNKDSEISNGNVTINSADTPLKINKKLRFYIENENQAKPISFQLNFNFVRNRQFSQDTPTNIIT